MKKLVKISATYAACGIIFGVYYRELTKFMGFSGKTTLAFTHLHTLVLGMFMFLILLLLAKQFKIHEHPSFKKFLTFYNIGLIMMIAMLLIRGTLQVFAFEFSTAIDASISGISGIGHVILTIGLFFLFKILFAQVKD